MPSSVDITQQSELGLYGKAFAALSSAASYGGAAEKLPKKAHSFWTNTPLQE